MKKKTKLQTTTEAKPRQHGPQKEKTQITIRVDTRLINAAYSQMKKDNARITDIIERGIVLALTESKHRLPQWDKEVRFMVANATKDQQVLLRGLLIAMAERLLVLEDPLRASVYTPETEKLFEVVCWFLENSNLSPRADAALEHYSRYGKSAEELAELAARKTAGS